MLIYEIMSFFILRNFTNLYFYEKLHYKVVEIAYNRISLASEFFSQLIRTQSSFSLIEVNALSKLRRNDF